MMTRFIRALLFAVVMLAGACFAQVRIAIRFGPPPLPVYEQPVCPGEDYIWVPGYWAYDYDYSDYYWVPGTWVLAPEPGYFWTPGYWGWENQTFIFHEGYWGPHVGFYGGINYGYGYFGDGYEGGRWDRGHFFYNRTVNNVNVTVVRNVYNTTVINKTKVVNRVSYNGGNGGVNVRPRPEEEVAARDRHIAPVSAQTQHMREARSDPQQRASTNRGRPEVAATPNPAAFKDRAVASQAGGAWNPPANRSNAGDNRGPNNDNRAQNNNVPRPGNNIVHPKDIPQVEYPAPPNTGDAKRDQKYQQQQEKMDTKQEQQRQKLEQKQEQEHQKMQRQKADEQRQQQIEQHHQQQTQKLEHKQEQQIQKMQARQEPKLHSPNALKP